MIRRPPLSIERVRCPTGSIGMVSMDSFPWNSTPMCLIPFDVISLVWSCLISFDSVRFHWIPFDRLQFLELVSIRFDSIRFGSIGSSSFEFFHSFYSLMIACTGSEGISSDCSGVPPCESGSMELLPLSPGRTRGIYEHNYHPGKHT